MTSKSSKPTDPLGGQLFVVGLGEGGKPKGARFPASETKLLDIGLAMGLGVYEATNEEFSALGMKLPVGRIYARGRAFIPNIKQDLYDRLKSSFLNNGASEKGTTEQDPKVASGLPRSWDEIAPGHLVLSEEVDQHGEGFWECIVQARENDILTLRFRDYPKAPKFNRHVASVALINPGPPS